MTAFNTNGADIEDAGGNAIIGQMPNLSGVLQIDTATPAPTVASVVTSGTGITNGNGDLNAGSVVTLTLTMSEAVTVAAERQR